MFRNYTLDEINTSDYRAVEKAVIEAQRDAFPDADSVMIAQLFSDVNEIFSGNFWEYQAIDTVYHDLEHTLLATLCWLRLLTNRHFQKVTPVLEDNDFENGLFAILLHDIGFLKEQGETEGTGAKYTFVHKQRSCELAALYLTQKDWSNYDILIVQHLISCTGPRSIIDAVPFNNPRERIVGESICTADYLGQMSDHHYVNKLSSLYREFEESDDYRNIPRDNRIFKSHEDLIRSTPYFWGNIVIPKLEDECHGLYKYLAQPYPDGVNPYMNKIEENIDFIRNESENLSKWKKYFGKRSLK